MEEGVSGPLIKGEPCGGMGPGGAGVPCFQDPRPGCCLAREGVGLGGLAGVKPLAVSFRLPLRKFRERSGAQVWVHPPPAAQRPQRCGLGP